MEKGIKMCKTSISILLIALSVCCDSSLLRQTQNGPVQGVERTSVLGQKYYAFEGIPYAEPPITGTDPYTGEKVDRRFKATEPLKRKWSEPLKAHKIGSLCMPGEVLPSGMFSAEFTGLPDGMVLETSEDCLFINVYVPANGTAGKAVMVNIHGGGHAGGIAMDAFTGPDFLLFHGNIVVKFGYRVEKFGFLSLGYGEYTGNMALKDQQLALKWIHENIKNFGGNTEQILLFGGSSGAQYVHYHILNEESRKYFTRAFSSSGTAFGTFSLRRANYTEMMQNCFKINDMDRLIEFLKTASQADLVNCTSPSWYPTIESPNTKGAFLTKSPEEVYRSDSPPIVDVLFAFASKEALQAKPELLNATEPLLLKDWNETDLCLRYEGFKKETHPNEYKMIVKKLEEVYYANATNLDAIRSDNIALLSDLHLTYSVIKSIALQADANNRGMNKSQHRNTFLYRYSFNFELNALRSRTPYKNFSYAGAAHSDDVHYLFYCVYMTWKDDIYEKHLKTKNIVYDQIMRLTELLTNFARTGDPSIKGDTPFLSCKSSDEIFCQEVSNELTTRITYNIKEQIHYDLWHEIDEIVEFALNQTTANKSKRLIHAHHLIETLFVAHVVLYFFACNWYH